MNVKIITGTTIAGLETAIQAFLDSKPLMVLVSQSTMMEKISGTLTFVTTIIYKI